MQSYDRDKISNEAPELHFGIVDASGSKHEVAATAREVAEALQIAADVLSAPPSRGQRYSSGPLQQRAISRIRALIATHPLSQNSIAVAASYSPDELSAFMVGRAPMDLVDLERLAGVLGTDPADLLTVDRA